MPDIADLPTVNATLNMISFVLLMAGYVSIRTGRLGAHKACMSAALVVSILFLISYGTYRVLGEEKRFAGSGWIRPVYFAILISHVALAAAVPFLAVHTLIQGLKGRIARHRRIARITFPIWVYVSMTGVLVYLFLFRMYGPAAPVGG